MKRLLFLPALGAGLVLAQGTEPPVQVAKAIPVAAQPPAPKAEASGKEEAVDDSPSPLPALDQYAKLWTDSLFTTRALPAPDVPAGPNFTDNLTLVGTVEDKGKLTATLIDKTTSGVVQAFIGEDNSEGYRISKVEMSDAKEVKRIQLQKGNQVGWLSFGESAPAAGGNDPGNALNAGGPVATRPGNIPPLPQPQPTLFPAGSAPAPAGLQNVLRAMQAMPVIPAAVPAQPANAAPAMRTGLPDAPPSLPGDPPLPPP